MRALNSLAAKMSEKWEMLHFPLRGRRQVLLESEETAPQRQRQWQWQRQHPQPWSEGAPSVVRADECSSKCQQPVRARWLYSQTHGSARPAHKHQLKTLAWLCSSVKTHMCVPPANITPQWARALSTSWYHFLFQLSAVLFFLSFF